MGEMYDKVFDEAKIKIANLPIIDVLSQMYALNFSCYGDGYLTECVMHNDFPKTLVISGSRYSCEVCGSSGGALDYVSRYEGLCEFDATIRVCEVLGIPYSEYGEIDRQTRFSIHDAYDAASRFYQKMLFEPEGKWALDYLKSRLNPDSILKFDLGYAPFSGLYRNLRAQRFSSGLLLEAQLIVSKDTDDFRESYRDFFINRIMFPMMDSTGRTIAFAGRAEQGSKYQKYINSRQSPIFDKSKALYGINLAQKHIRSKKKVLIVEGPTDVIAHHEIGIENVVGTVGTAVTSHHLNVLSRMADQVICCLDDDDAGRRASIRAGEQALGIGVNLGFIKVGGMDPYERIKSDPEGYKEILESPLSLMEFAFLSRDLLNMIDPDKQYLTIKDELFSLLDKQKSFLHKALWLKQVALAVGLEPKTLFHEYKVHLKDVAGTRNDGRLLEDYVLGYAANVPIARRNIGKVIKGRDFSKPYKGWLWEFFTKSTIEDHAIIKPQTQIDMGPLFPNNHSIFQEFKEHCERRGFVLHQGQLSELESTIIRTKNTNPKFVERMRIEVLEKELVKLEERIDELDLDNISLTGNDRTDKIILKYQELMEQYDKKYKIWQVLKFGTKG